MVLDKVGFLWKIIVVFDNYISEFVLESFFIVVLYVMNDNFYKNCDIIGL